MYKDAQLHAADDKGVPVTIYPPVEQRLVLGKDSYTDNDTPYIQATVDELKVYERALTTLEIPQLYERYV